MDRLLGGQFASFRLVEPWRSLCLLLLPALRRQLLLLLGRFRLVAHVSLLSDGETRIIVTRVTQLDGWRICPRCGADLEVGDAKVDCASCGLVFYAHSAVTANAVCVAEDGRILLTRRAGPPYRGYWDIPGGFVGEGEHPLEALERELREETGLAIEPRDFLGIWMDRYSEDDSGVATMNLYWVAEVTGGEPEAADDVSELRWCTRHELLSFERLLAFRCNGPVLSAFLGQTAAGT